MVRNLRAGLWLTVKNFRYNRPRSEVMYCVLSLVFQPERKPATRTKETFNVDPLSVCTHIIRTSRIRALVQSATTVVGFPLSGGLCSEVDRLSNKHLLPKLENVTASNSRAVGVIRLAHFRSPTSLYLRALIRKEQGFLYINDLLIVQAMVCFLECTLSTGATTKCWDWYKHWTDIGRPKAGHGHPNLS